MPIGRRFHITAFFKSFSSAKLERFFPLGNPVVKQANLFRSQIVSSWTLGSTKLTVDNLIAAIWLIVFGQEHYNSIWILTMPYLPDRTAYFLALTHMVVSSIWFCTPLCLPLLLEIEFLSFPISVGEYDDILPSSVSKIVQIKVRDKLDPSNVWRQTIESKELPQPTSADFSTVPTVRHLYFFPHTKLLNETNGYLYNNTMYLEISFFDPPIPTTENSSLFPFP